MEYLQLADYLAILKRRKKLFLFVSAPLLALAIMFAMTWSNYRSEATVEVAQSEIPDSMTTPAGMNASNILESLADMRISRLQQKVLSTGSLVEIITKFNLYAKARQNTPIADIADKMRKKVHIELVGSSLANPASAQKVSADQLSAIAFTLSFDYENALISQQVTNELISHFLDEDIKERRRQAEETSAFLDSQIKIIEASLMDQEKQIADFRSKHGDTRPETLAFNQQAAASAQMNMQNLDGRVDALVGTIGALRGQLASIDPYSRVMAEGQILTTPTVQLKTLKSTYATLTAKYGPTHPDVLRAKRQIESLETQTSGGENSAILNATLLDAQGKLETAQKTYGDKNPDVIALKHQVESLNHQVKAAEANVTGTTNGLKEDADNPIYVQIVAQLKTTEEQYKALMKQRGVLQDQLNKYQTAILQNPAAEQKLAELSRDYDNSQFHYRDLKAKKMAADMSATIEEDRSGQRLVVINPPELPSKTRPTRILFLLGGLILSIAAGFGSIVGMQILSQSVVGAHHLESIVGVAPLITIPHLRTQNEDLHNTNKRLRLIGASVLGLILLLTLFSYTVMPLDVVWAVLSRKLGLS